MRFLSSGALWWLLLSAPIIFFYLLKLKRKRLVVPSILLWHRALEEIEANAPFRRLRKSLLLILQLAALALLVFALARPMITTRALASGSTVIVLDSTASMSARDQDGSTRLSRARDLAREMVDGLSATDRASIIESSARVVVRSPLTSDRPQLRRAIDEVRETDSAGNLADALRLAEQIARAERDAGIIVISDGGGSSPQSESARSATPVQALKLRFVRVGSRTDNCGIVSMNARPLQGGVRQELFAALGNFGMRERDIGVELRIDGRLVDARTTKLAANSRGTLIYDSLPPGGGLAELKLDVTDDLTSDNVAYALLPDSRKLRVGVASDDPFLAQALAVNPDLDARRITPGTALAELDCIVIDGAPAAGILESHRPLLAINPRDTAEMGRTFGALEKPAISSVDRAHPVNEYLSYADLHIETAAKREAASWLKPIVSSGGDGLIWAGDDGRRRAVLIGFDLAQSDLPLKVEFPLLLANSISWLVRRDSEGSERVVRAGQPVTLRSAQPALALSTPDGRAEEIAVSDGAAIFADTMLVGTYAVKDQPPFAVTLLSEAETDTTPRDSIKTREGGEVSGAAETFKSEREAWRWIALATLMLLAVEWWIYHRRITL